MKRLSCEEIEKIRQSRYTVDEKTGCWLSTGKARCRFGGKSIMFRKFMYEEEFGAIPKGEIAYPECQNERCGNPGHMIILPYKEFCSLKKKCLLKQEEAIRIYELWDCGWTANKIASKYKLTSNHVRFILRGKSRVARIPNRPSVDPKKKMKELRRGRAKYIVDKKTRCWMSTSGDVSGKHLTEEFNGKHKSARRGFYEEIIGPIPEGKVLRAKCKTDRCVNPKHMLVLSRGESNSINSNAKLTEQRVKTMFKLRSRGWTLQRIGDKYGVHMSLVCKVLKGTRWVGRTSVSEGK